MGNAHQLFIRHGIYRSKVFLLYAIFCCCWCCCSVVEGRRVCHFLVMTWSLSPCCVFWSFCLLHFMFSSFFTFGVFFLHVPLWIIFVFYFSRYFPSIVLLVRSFVWVFLIFFVIPLVFFSLKFISFTSIYLYPTLLPLFTLVSLLAAHIATTACASIRLHSPSGK